MKITREVKTTVDIEMDTKTIIEAAMSGGVLDKIYLLRVLLNQLSLDNKLEELKAMAGADGCYLVTEQLDAFVARWKAEPEEEGEQWCSAEGFKKFLEKEGEPAEEVEVTEACSGSVISRREWCPACRGVRGQHAVSATCWECTTCHELIVHGEEKAEAS